MVHIREKPSNICSVSYMLFHSNSLFITNVEFSINNSVFVVYLLYVVRDDL